MHRKADLVVGETYHVYNRGAHKEATFIQPLDYERFLLLMHLSNNTEPIQLSRLASDCRKLKKPYSSIFKDETTDQSLVQILAYCLMPNHFHIVLRQVSEDGITKFMHRLATAYSMYFNASYAHSGVLFQGRFKSQIIDNEPYFRYIFSYVHTNSIDLIEPNWEDEGIADIKKVDSFVSNYTYSSFRDYHESMDRPERAILSNVDVPEFLFEQHDVQDLLKWARNK